MLSADLKQSWSRVRDLLHFHRKVLGNKFSGFGGKAGRTLMVSTVPVYVGFYVLAAGYLALPQTASGQVGLPLVKQVAMVGAVAAFLGWIVLPRPHPDVLPPEGSGAEHFRLSTGWSPLEKYAAWVIAGFEPILKLWGIIGLEVVAYLALAQFFPKLGIAEFSSFTAHPIVPEVYILLNPVLYILLNFLVGVVMLGAAWLVLLLYLALFHLLRTVLELYLRNTWLAVVLFAALSLYIIGTGVAYTAMFGFEQNEILSVNAFTSDYFTSHLSYIAVVPELLILLALPAAFLLQRNWGRWRAWVVRPSVWLIPCWGLVSIGSAFYLEVVQSLSEAQPVVLGLLTEPLLLSSTEGLAINPMEILAAMLIDNGPMRLHAVNPAYLTNSPVSVDPGLRFGLEAAFIGLTLLWCAALAYHGYLAYHNRTYGRDNWALPLYWKSSD